MKVNSNYLINPLYLRSILQNAGVVKLVDTLDLGSSASRLGGSSPSTRTSFFLYPALTPTFPFRFYIFAAR